MTTDKDDGEVMGMTENRFTRGKQHLFKLTFG